MAMYDFAPINNINPYSLSFGSGGGGQGQGMQLPPAAGSPLGYTPPPAAGNGAGGFELGFNGPTLQMGLQGLNTLGNLWGALQSTKLAREQLNFTRNVTNTNLNNSVKSYNTALEDRARARGFTQGQSDSDVNNYIANNRLSR